MKFILKLQRLNFEIVRNLAGWSSGTLCTGGFSRRMPRVSPAAKAAGTVGLQIIGLQ
jgi:hypothetical protein